MTNKYSAVVRVRICDKGNEKPLRIIAELEVSGSPSEERLLVERQVEQAHLCTDTLNLTKALSRYYGPTSITTIEVKFHEE
jgi:hypothetical protein